MGHSAFLRAGEAPHDLLDLELDDGAQPGAEGPVAARLEIEEARGSDDVGFLEHVRGAHLAQQALVQTGLDRRQQRPRVSFAQRGEGERIARLRS